MNQRNKYFLFSSANTFTKMHDSYFIIYQMQYINTCKYIKIFIREIFVIFPLDTLLCRLLSFFFFFLIRAGLHTFVVRRTKRLGLCCTNINTFSMTSLLHVCLCINLCVLFQFEKHVVAACDGKLLFMCYYDDFFFHHSDLYLAFKLVATQLL